MNVSLIILFIIAVILIVLLIILNITGMTAWAQQRETVIIENTDLCIRPLDQLIAIDRTQNICCYNNGALTGAYFVDTEINGQKLGFSTIPVSTYYINVCREYCSNGYTVNENGTIQCEGETATGPQTVTANNCVDLIEPILPDGQPCRGSAMPIAALGITYYYALHADTPLGIAGCQNLGPCP